MIKLVEFIEYEDGSRCPIVPVLASSDLQGGVKASTTTDEAYILKMKLKGDGFLHIPVESDLRAPEEGLAAEAASTNDALSYVVYTPTGDDLAESKWDTSGECYDGTGELTTNAKYYFSRVTLEQGAYYLMTNQTSHKSTHSNVRLYSVRSGVYTQIWASSEERIMFRCPIDENAMFVLQLSYNFTSGGERSTVYKCNISRKSLGERINLMLDDAGREPTAYTPNALDIYEDANILTNTTQGSYRGTNGDFTINEEYSYGEVNLKPGYIYHVCNPDARTARMWKKLPGGEYRIMAQCTEKDFYFETPDDATEIGQYVFGLGHSVAHTEKPKPTLHPIHVGEGASTVLMNKLKDATDRGDKCLRVIAFGGHNVLDMLSYVPIMAARYGVRIDMILFYRTSMTLQQLHDEWDTTASHNVYWYSSMLSGGTGKWSNITSNATGWTSPAKILSENGPFDLIIFNQDRVQAPTASSFNIFSSIMTKLHNTVDYTFNLGWINSPTYKTKDVPETVLANTKAFYPKYPFDLILPGGTAWMNACTDATLAACGASTYGKMWYTDNSCIEDGIGCYICACACLEAIFRKYFPTLTTYGDQFRMTFDGLTDYSIPGKQVVEASFNAGMTERNCHMAWRAAILANNFPFEVKQI